MENLIISNLSVAYQNKLVFENMSFNIPKGSLTGVIGPNGAGKSTLLKGLLGIIPTLSREVTVGEQSIDKLKASVAYVEQRSSLDLTFPINVFETVLLGTYPSLGIIKRPGRKEKVRAELALEKVGLLDYKDKQIGELSGGQLQRVFMARVLAQDAEYVFLDEPFVGIDLVSEQVIVEILQEMQQSGKTIMVVHHDLHKVQNYFDDLIILNGGLVAHGHVNQVFNADNIERAFGKNLSSLGFSGEAC